MQYWLLDTLYLNVNNTTTNINTEQSLYILQLSEGLANSAIGTKEVWSMCSRVTG